MVNIILLSGGTQCTLYPSCPQSGYKIEQTLAAKNYIHYLFKARNYMNFYCNNYPCLFQVSSNMFLGKGSMFYIKIPVY